MFNNFIKSLERNNNKSILEAILEGYNIFENSIGYSTHGNWASSKDIYEIEDERGNVVDPVLLKDGYKAIWVCINKEDCKRYADYNEVRPIDLTNAIHVKSMDDGDGGELWMKKINNLVEATIFEGKMALNQTEALEYPLEDPPLYSDSFIMFCY